MDTDSFQLEEYKALTQEMQNLMKEARQLELYSASGVAAIFA